MRKVYFIIITLGFFTAASMLYLYSPKLLDTLDKKIKDSFFVLRGPIPASDMVTIIDIDEKSLSKFGQWPWERKILAKIVKNLTDAQAGIIGYDIFFAEKDKNRSNDFLFAEALRNSPSILGLMFNFEKNVSKNILPNIPAVFIQKNFSKEFLPEAKGYLANIPLLQQSVYSSGFVNMIPDIDGVVRYVPLLIKYKDGFYPSLAFEMYRLAKGYTKIIINYTPNGVESIMLDNNETVDTDRFGRMFINYRGAKGKFRYLSALDVYNNSFDASLVKNRFVIMGTTSAGLFDLRATPFESVYPGVEIQATLLDNLLKHDIISKPEYEELINILIMLVTAVLSAFIIYRFSAIYSFTAVTLLIAALYYTEYYFFVHKGIILNTIYPLLLIILISLILTTVNYLFEHKNTIMIKKAFAKKVSPKVMEELLKNPGHILEPKEKEITVYFSDIRDFTSISERIANPKKLIKLLNSYFNPVSNIIIKHQGTIDKFIGDAVMAYWNAPYDCENHADLAVSCAIEHINTLKPLNKKLQKEFGVKISVGIGINTGNTTVGEMGSEGRADYTVIGDSVNLASRIEGLNKYYGTKILISEHTKAQLKNSYAIREIDTVLVKGKKQPVTIYEVKGFGKETFDEYHKALEHYKNKEFKKALGIFESLNAENNDKIYQIYIQRCRDYIQNPDKEFSYVYKFDKK